MRRAVAFLQIVWCRRAVANCIHTHRSEGPTRTGTMIALYYSRGHQSGARRWSISYRPAQEFGSRSRNPVGCGYGQTPMENLHERSVVQEPLAANAVAMSIASSRETIAASP